jgi:hypothetical protein
VGETFLGAWLAAVVAVPAAIRGRPLALWPCWFWQCARYFHSLISMCLAVLCGQWVGWVREAGRREGNGRWEALKQAVTLSTRCFSNITLSFPLPTQAAMGPEPHTPGQSAPLALSPVFILGAMYAVVAGAHWLRTRCVRAPPGVSWSVVRGLVGVGEAAASADPRPAVRATARELQVGEVGAGLGAAGGGGVGSPLTLPTAEL